MGNNIISLTYQKKVNIVLAIVIISLIVICIYLHQILNDYFIKHLNGFWISNTIEGQCILYFDKDNIRIINVNEILESKTDYNCTYELSSQTYFNFYTRTYKLKINDISNKISKILNKPNLFIDLYPIEGACVIYDNDGDLLTFIKDNQSSVELLV